MPFVTKAQILEAKDRPFEDVEVKEWGGTVRLVAMSALERDSQELRHLDIREGKRAGSIRANLVAACLVDPETMQPLFSADELDALADKSGAVLGRLFKIASRLNAIDAAEVEAVKGE